MSSSSNVTIAILNVEAKDNFLAIPLAEQQPLSDSVPTTRRYVRHKPFKKTTDSVTSTVSLHSSDFNRITLDPTNTIQPNRPTWEKDGEYRLFQAVLEDALDVISKYRKQVSRHQQPPYTLRCAYRETIEWIQTVGASDLMDFESVCGIVGIDPDAVREGVLGTKWFMPVGRLRNNNAGSRSHIMGRGEGGRPRKSAAVEGISIAGGEVE